MWARLTLEAAAAHNQTSGRSHPPPPLVLLPCPLSRVAVDGLLLGLLFARVFPSLKEITARVA